MAQPTPARHASTACQAHAFGTGQLSHRKAGEVWAHLLAVYGRKMAACRSYAHDNLHMPHLSTAAWISKHITVNSTNVAALCLTSVLPLTQKSRAVDAMDIMSGYASPSRCLVVGGAGGTLTSGIGFSSSLVGSTTANAPSFAGVMTAFTSSLALPSPALSYWHKAERVPTWLLKLTPGLKAAALLLQQASRVEKHACKLGAEAIQ